MIPLRAQNAITSNPPDTLIVGIAGSEPFVFKRNSATKGIAIEIWEDIANKQSQDYRYISFETVDAALNALNNGELDLVVGPISITSHRLEFMRFSQPFYNSSLAIVSRADKLSLWEKIKPFFSIKLLMAVAIFLFILAVVGTFLWLAERKQSPEQFPEDPINGIANGMWLAIVTMSTTGYGDKAPVTLWGRIIAGSWMVISIIFATSMVAGIASTLTLSSLSTSTISNIEQLSGRKAATISASPSEDFLKEYNIKTVTTSTLNEAITHLKNKEVDAVVYDRPQLLYFLKKHNENLYITNAEYYKQGYGFAFPLNTTLIYDINRALLELAEDQEIQRIVDYYLNKDK
ncbi:MAG: transporter substrate-binding domain-containing protein [Lentimicrobium sp.]|nr:transporter substrate-binding domain-containing protein [Lentimicrobium sp.]